MWILHVCFQTGRKADKFVHFEDCCTNCGFVHLNMFITLISVAHFGHQRAVLRIDYSFTKTGAKMHLGTFCLLSLDMNPDFHDKVTFLARIWWHARAVKANSAYLLPIYKCPKYLWQLLKKLAWYTFRVRVPISKWSVAQVFLGVPHRKTISPQSQMKGILSHHNF